MSVTSSGRSSTSRQMRCTSGLLIEIDWQIFFKIVVLPDVYKRQGRTLHPDNMGAGPASYGMTDTMGRMHSDAQFAGSSSVPAHVDMMGLIGMGNNPMVGATVACAVAVNAAINE